jgi:hypothetical protein
MDADVVELDGLGEGDEDIDFDNFKNEEAMAVTDVDRC